VQPMCVPCLRWLRCERNEAQVGRGVSWHSGDRYVCDGCGADVVAGISPVSTTYEPAALMALVERGLPFYTPEN